MKGAENIRGVILEEAKENAEKIAAESRKKCKKISDEGQAKAAEFLEKAGLTLQEQEAIFHSNAEALFQIPCK